MYCRELAPIRGRTLAPDCRTCVVQVSHGQNFEDGALESKLGSGEIFAFVQSSSFRVSTVVGSVVMANVYTVHVRRLEEGEGEVKGVPVPGTR